MQSRAFRYRAKTLIRLAFRGTGTLSNIVGFLPQLTAFAFWAAALVGVSRPRGFHLSAPLVVALFLAGLLVLFVVAAYQLVVPPFPRVTHLTSSVGWDGVNEAGRPRMSAEVTLRNEEKDPIELHLRIAVELGNSQPPRELHVEMERGDKVTLAPTRAVEHHMLFTWTDRQDMSFRGGGQAVQVRIGRAHGLHHAGPLSDRIRLDMTSQSGKMQSIYLSAV